MLQAIYVYCNKFVYAIIAKGAIGTGSKQTNQRRRGALQINLFLKLYSVRRNFLFHFLVCDRRYGIRTSSQLQIHAYHTSCLYRLVVGSPSMNLRRSQPRLLLKSGLLQLLLLSPLSLRSLQPQRMPQKAMQIPHPPRPLQQLSRKPRMSRHTSVLEHK